MSTGSGFLVFLGNVFALVFWHIVAKSVNALNKTKLVAPGHIAGAPNENIVQNHLNIALLNVF